MVPQQAPLYLIRILAHNAGVKVMSTSHANASMHVDSSANST